MADDTFSKRNPREPRQWVSLGASELFEWLRPQLGEFEPIPNDVINDVIGQVWWWVQRGYIRHRVLDIEPGHPWFHRQWDRDFGDLVTITARGWDLVEWQPGLIKGTDCKIQGLCADIERAIFAVKQAFKRQAPAAASSASASATNFVPIINNITFGTGAPAPSAVQATVPEPETQRGSQTVADPPAPIVALTNADVPPASTPGPMGVPRTLLRTILAQYAPGSTKLERLQAALKSGRIRHRIDPGQMHFQPVPGVSNYMIVDEKLWEDRVDWYLGWFHHPFGGLPRAILFCEEDYHAWLREEQSSIDPQREGGAADPPSKSAEKMEIPAPAEQTHPTLKKKHPGGRPPHKAYRLVENYMARLYTEGRISSRSSLRKHLMEWLTPQCSKLPDPRTISDWVLKLCPPDVPEDDPEGEQPKN